MGISPVTASVVARVITTVWSSSSTSSSNAVTVIEAVVVPAPPAISKGEFAVMAV